MSAGGSMVHPHVSCMLLTPICPHSLSFRPLILPESTTLKIKVSEFYDDTKIIPQVPDDARGTAWVSFDGRNRQELQRGDSLVVYTSVWPLPGILYIRVNIRLAICRGNHNDTSEWFRNLAKCLHWNVRQHQKPLKHSDTHVKSESS